MLTNIRVLIAACQELNIDFKFLHSSHNFVQLKINSHPYLFANYTTPFNSEVNAAICKDKGLTYELLKNKVRIPKTISFLSPFCKEKYQKYSDRFMQSYYTTIRVEEIYFDSKR